MAETSSSEEVSTKLQQVAELAKKAPEMAFTTLSHHIDVWFLYEALLRTRADGAPGVDGQTAAQYAQSLGTNLRLLLDRFKSGTYRAPAVRRVHIPKADGTKTRPIGVPTFEDKVLQRAVAMVLEAVYEQDFLGCSYGFRPGRSAHQALEALVSCLVPLASISRAPSTMSSSAASNVARSSAPTATANASSIGSLPWSSTLAPRSTPGSHAEPCPRIAPYRQPPPLTPRSILARTLRRHLQPHPSPRRTPLPKSLQEHPR